MYSMYIRKHCCVIGAMIVLGGLLLCGCGAHREALKKAGEFKTQSQFMSATRSAIEALKLKPDYIEAKLLLQETAPKAYADKLQHAQRFEQEGNHEKALSEYRELQSFVREVNRYDVHFATEDIEGKIRAMATGAAEQHYAHGEDAFAKGDYPNAVTAYGEALRLQSGYKDAREKTAEAHYRLGMEAFPKGLLRQAAANFGKSQAAVSGYKDASQKAAEALYILGNYFLDQKLCRAAYTDLEAVQRFMPGYKNTAERLGQAERCAQELIAFLPFEKKVRADMAGMAIDDFLFEEVKAKVNSRGTKFIRVIERQQLTKLLEEQGLSLQGVVEGSPVFKKLKGVNYLVFGKINQVTLNQQPRHAEGKQVGYKDSYCYEVSAGQDKKGKPKTRTKCDDRDATFTYTEYTEAFEAILAGAISVTSVTTGDVRVSYQIDRRKNDAVRYAENPGKDPTQVNIPKDIKALFSQPKDLQSRDALLKTVIGEISNELAAKILQAIDVTPPTSDPPQEAVAGAVARALGSLGGAAEPARGKPARR